MNTVEIGNVTKTFGRHVAVDELSLNVPAGSVYGFIGPNGSGKTTTLRMIMNIFYPDSGEIRVFGEKMNGSCTSRIGYLPEERGLYRKMKLRELLRFYGELQEARQASEGEAVGVPLIMVMLMFLMLMTGAIPLLNSVMEEKTMRIAEVLLGSIQPFEFMMGKVLGGIAVSLTTLGVYAAVSIGGLSYAGMGEFIPYHLLPWFCAYTIFAILMMGSLLASFGAACNDVKEAQSLTLPALLPMMVPMFILMPVLEEPMSAWATIMSLIPPFTPMLMILRQSTPMTMPAWQPWAGLAGVIVASILAVWAGGRIFRVGILMQGQPPKLGDMWRWVIKG